MKHIIGIFVIILLVFSINISAKDKCSKQEALVAEEKVDGILSWDDLYQYYLKYKECDSGAISEGLSNSIEILLVNKWDDLFIIYKMTSEKKRFKLFFLKHIDETMSQKNAEIIYYNIKNKCDNKTKEFCALIKNEMDKYQYEGDK